MTKNNFKGSEFTALGILQLKKNDDCKNIHSVNRWYLLIDHSNGYTEERDVNKYLFFDSTVENKELLSKHKEIFNGIRDKIKETNSGGCDYEKDNMKNLILMIIYH